MKKIVFAVFMVCVLVLIPISACSSPAKIEPKSSEINAELEAFREFYKIGPGFYSITSKEISQSIWFLAGPDYQGRASGTKGNRKAGLFLMGELESYSLDTQFSQEFRYDQIKNLQSQDAAKYLFFLGFEVKKEGRNIVGILEGTEKKEEYVVISAHYDHLGINRDGRVYLGADDNASGSAAVLEIAEAFGMLAKEGIKPERGVIFAFFDAEEKGLWGSQYFVENPPVPLDQIVAVLNLDMIGRNEPEKLTVAAYAKSHQFFQTIARANTILKLGLVRDQSLFDYSDQASFLNAGTQGSILLAVLFTSGLHQDYHTPSDTPDKINFEKVRNVARLSFFIAWLISNLG